MGGGRGEGAILHGTLDEGLLQLKKLKMAEEGLCPADNSGVATSFGDQLEDMISPQYVSADR